jgi:thiol:disulfide interchange protein
VTGCGTERNQVVFTTMGQSESLKADKEPQKIVFVNDFKSGVRSAAEQGRPVLAFFTLPQCANAQQMMETTFCDAEIRKLSQRFVCVLVDASQNASMCEERNVNGFPTILLLSSQGTEIQRMSGRQNADQLSVQMQVALQSTASQLMSTVRSASPLNR